MKYWSLIHSSTGERVVISSSRSVHISKGRAGQFSLNTPCLSMTGHCLELLSSEEEAFKALMEDSNART